MRIAASGSEQGARTILVGLGVLVGVLFVGYLLFLFAKSTADHIQGVPRFIREFTGQFFGILIGGAVAGLILAAIGLNVLLSFLIGLAAAAVAIVWVAR